MEIRTDSKIYKRKDGRWCVSYYGMETNARRHYLYGKTKSEVKLKLAELEHPIQSQQQDEAVRNVEKEEPVIEVSSVEPEAESKEDAMVKLNGANSDAGTKWTLQAWVRYYLETYKKNEIKETTFDSYMGIYRRRIAKSKIGKSKLEDLTGDDFQKEYNQMVSDGCKASTIRHLFILINMALNRAVQLRYIMENPNQLVTLPRKNRFEGKTLTAEEARRIFEKAKDDELYPIVALTLCTGLRKGEAEQASSGKEMDSIIKKLYEMELEEETSQSDSIDKKILREVRRYLEENEIKISREGREAEESDAGDIAFALAEIGEEAGFVRGFKCAFRLFSECVR